MKLSELQGQPKVVESLTAAIASRRLHHAWLFVGPRGVGKRTAAFAFAAAVNCEKGPTDACGECPSCIKMRSGNHPDLHLVASLDRAEELDLAGHVITEAEAAEGEEEEEDGKEGKAPSRARRVITIRQVRALDATMLRKSMEGRYKVAIVIDADQMNMQAANALLKTLEEPMGASLIVLTSSAPARLPATIPSRCQRLRFMALPEPVVAEMLARRHDMDPARAAVLAHLADGSVGRALALDHEDLAGWAVEAVARIAQVPRMPAADALDLAEEYGKGRERAETARRLLALFDILGIFYRDAAAGLWAVGWAPLLGGKTGPGPMEAAAGDVIANFELLDEARRAIELHCSPQVTLESLFMKMRHAARR